MRISSRSLFVLMLSLAVPLRTVAADKDLVQLQSSVQNLRNQIAQAQTSVDEAIGLMTDRLKRNGETARSLQQSLESLQGKLHGDAFPTEQVQKMSSEASELSVALDKFKTQAASIGAPRNATATEAESSAPPVPPAATGSSGPPVPSAAIGSSTPPASQPPQPPPGNAALADLQKPSPVAPAGQSPPAAPSAAAGADHQPDHQPSSVAPPTVAPPTTSAALYESAMEHYADKDFEIAGNEFTKYLNTDSQSDNAVNAHFYLGEIEFRQEDFEGALRDYTAVATRLTDKAKAATAQYKKALCLLQVERRDEAVEELQIVVQQYPGSPEAARAAKKLHELGAHKK